MGAEGNKSISLTRTKNLPLKINRIKNDTVTTFAAIMAIMKFIV